MTPADIDKFLQHLSPEQETVVILKDIKALLQALLELHTPLVTVGPIVPLEDLIANIVPTPTPFSERLKAGNRKQK